MFKFEYKIYDKYSLNRQAGYFLSFDDRFNTLEYCILDSNGDILESNFYEFNDEYKNRLINILNDYQSILSFNSYMFDSINSSIEMMIYIEIKDKNRKIEGNRLLSNKIINSLLNDIFNLCDISNIKIGK